MTKLQKFLSTHVPLADWEYVMPTDSTFAEYAEQSDWNQTLMVKINQTSATIFKDTNRAGANVIIISDNMLKIFETLVYLDAINISDEYVIGSLVGRYRVYCIPKLTDKHKIFVCRLTDNTKIFDVDNYEMVGVVDVNIPFNLKTNKFEI